MEDRSFLKFQLTLHHLNFITDNKYCEVFSLKWLGSLHFCENICQIPLIFKITVCLLVFPSNKKCPVKKAASSAYKPSNGTRAFPALECSGGASSGLPISSQRVLKKSVLKGRDSIKLITFTVSSRTFRETDFLFYCECIKEHDGWQYNSVPFSWSVLRHGQQFRCSPVLLHLHCKWRKKGQLTFWK